MMRRQIAIVRGWLSDLQVPALPRRRPGGVATSRPYATTSPAPILLGPLPGGADRVPAARRRPAGGDPPPADRRSSRPLVVLIHGLTGTADSGYILVSALCFLEQDYPVLRLNLRGAGASKRFCRSSYHAGRSDDLRRSLGQMDGRLAPGLLLVGYSLGGNMLLKYLGEQGRRAIGPGRPASPPDRPRRRATHLMRLRNKPYHRRILLRDEEEWESRGLDRWRSANPGRRRDHLRFRRPYRCAAHGFRGCPTTTPGASALNLPAPDPRPDAGHPRLDEPWIPCRRYRDVDWPATRG